MPPSRLDEAIHYRETGQFQEAYQIFAELHTATPDDPMINYQMAWWHDAQGREREAVPYYERAISNGLSGTDLQGALLGLGSTYRCLGRYDEAITTLRKGAATFPDAREFPVFLAMALYNIGQHAEAMSLLLRNLIETSHDEGILSYSKAIMFYQDKLDRVWD